MTDSPAPASARVSAVPRRLRLLLAVAAVVVVVVMTVVALTLTTSSTGVVRFGTVDQFSMFGIGLVIAAGLLFLGRARVDADATGVRFRNFALEHALPWTAVRAVAFERKSPWASLVLRNGDEVALFAVQAVDRERALRAVEGLRALLAAARAQEPTPPPLLYDN